MNLLQSKFLGLTAAALLLIQLLAAWTPGVQGTPLSVRDPVQMHPAVSGVQHGDEQHGGQHGSAARSTAKTDRFAFQQAMRKLWEDHVTWTRVYIISAVAGLPDTDAAAQRLLQNQVDIGAAIKPFYGEQAGNQLTSLLKDHILIATEVLAAAKAGDNARFEDANTRWYDNGNQIAAFLNGANPNSWPLSDMQAMMKAHLDLTLAEASARLHADWTGDVTAYDKVHDEILGMADMLAAGILQQFPQKFN